MSVLPRGIVTFLSAAPAGLAPARSRLEAGAPFPEPLLAAAARSQGGHVLAETASLLVAVFAAPAAALLALQAYLAGPAARGCQFKLALHSGPAQPHNGSYLGATLRRVRCLMEAAHPGQALISQATFNLVQSQAAHEASLRDLGPQRLADMLRPEHVFQLLTAAQPDLFPALATLDRFTHNLPLLPTPLIGRGDEIRDVSDLLHDPLVRLVTVLGPSGTGKTRLSLQVGAALLESFADGVFVVSLAPVTEADLVLPAIATVLDIQEEAGQPLITTLCRQLARRELLLILDNVEQLVDATPAIQRLLSQTAALKIIATSQVLLNIPEEVGYLLPPLAVPSPTDMPALDQLGRFPAVALFIECAQAVNPGWELTEASAPAVIELCARLAGLPLAIELAAAHSDCWPPQDMLVTLRSRLVVAAESRKGSSRAHTLQHVLGWSYAQLSAEERALLARLSVFAGGCTLAEATAVCAAPGGVVKNIVEGVDGLLNRHLLVQEELAGGDLRYIMLDAIREYARAQLDESGDRSVWHHQHALCYLELAEQADLALRSPDAAIWLTRLENAHHNLRTALEWLLGSSANDLAVRLGGALARFWVLRGHYTQGRRWLEAILERGGAAADQPLAKALNGLATLALMQSDFGVAASRYEQALALHRRMGNQAESAGILNNLGVVAASQGRYEQAQAYYRECLAIQAKRQDWGEMARILTNLGVIAQEQGCYAQALERYEQSLALGAERDDLANTAISYLNLGELALIQREYGRARQMLDRTLELARQLGERQLAADTLVPFGQLALAEGQIETAGTLFIESLSLGIDLLDRRGIARALEGLALAKQAQAQPAVATRLLAAAAAVRESAQIPQVLAEREQLDRLQATLRQALDAAAFAAEWAVGAALTPEEVLRADGPFAMRVG